MTSFEWSHWSILAGCGQQQRARIGRAIVYGSCRRLFDILDFENDAPFLEPLLVAAGLEADAAAALPQVLIGHIHAQRERIEIDSRIELAADVNDEGFVVLPGLGYMHVGAAAPRVRLAYDLAAHRCSLLATGSEVAMDLLQEPHTSIGEIPVLVQKHPLVSRHATDIHGEAQGLGALRTDVSLLRLLNDALSLIRDVFPEYFALLTDTTKGFAMFSAPAINSFASETVHGVAFFSLPDIPSVPSFLEDVLHQCGHTIFGSIGFRVEEFLDADRDTPIAAYNKDPQDTRSIFVLCHALFTEHAIAEGLLRCLEGHALAAADAFEAQGRLALMLKKYQVDICNLYTLGSLVDEGVRLRAALTAAFEDIVERASGILSRLDLGGQGYNFDLRTFRDRNIQVT